MLMLLPLSPACTKNIFEWYMLEWFYKDKKWPSFWCFHSLLPHSVLLWTCHERLSSSSDAMQRKGKPGKVLKEPRKGNELCMKKGRRKREGPSVMHIIRYLIKRAISSHPHVILLQLWMSCTWYCNSSYWIFHLFPLFISVLYIVDIEVVVVVLWSMNSNTSHSFSVKKTGEILAEWERWRIHDCNANCVSV